MMHPRQHLSTEQAAHYLRLSVSFLKRARAAGQGPVHLRFGRKVAYDPADLDAWLARCRQGKA